MKKLLFTLLLYTCLAHLAGASLYRSYQTDDGLSHNSVWAAMQDSRGFMWFGTNDGLNRFDGLNFKVYRRIDNDSLSLGNNFIHCLLESHDGNILVGTKEGLYSYSPDSDNFRHISLDGHSFGDDRNSIHCLLLDKSGQLWVGCYGQGIYCLDSGMNVIRHFGDKSMPSRFITAMAPDISGVIWVGTDNAGLFRLDPITGKTSGTPVSNVNIQTIYRQSNNTLWIGTSAEGLFHFDPLSDSVRHITHISPASTPVYDIKALTPYSSNELILGSESGLLKLDCNTHTLQAFDDGYSYDNLPDKSIFAITRDNEGGFWLGTYFYGVCYRSPRVNAFSYYQAGRGGENHSGSNNIVKRIVEAPDGNIVLTSSRNGVSIFNPATHLSSVFPVKGLSDNIQGTMANNDELWISDYDRGIVVASYPSGKTTATYTTADGLPSNVVNTMYRTSRGHIYAGTSRGAAFFDGKAFIRIPALHSASVMKILEDYEGNLWFATHFHGLFRMTPDGNFTNYVNRTGDSSTLPGNNINNIFLDSRGTLWTGTEGEGLVLFNPSTGKVERRFTEADGGLPSNIIYSAQEDMAGNIWVSTGGGLVKISADDYSIQDFRYLENLLKIHYAHNSSLRSGTGNMLYFGGSGGFIAFDPAAIRPNDMVPTVRITDFYVNGQRDRRPADEKLKLELAASESTFGFDVACLSYLSPVQNTVAFRLDGFDRKWKTLPGTDRHIDYMNIPAGKYTLQIKGSNNDGVWSKPLELSIVVNRPFLLSNFMLVVYVLLLMLAVYILKRRLDASHRRKMVKFSHAKEKELYEAKIGFFTNIAHEIRTPLSLISAPLDTILKSGDGNERTRRNLVVMKSNVQRLLELINQLLDFRKVESQLMRLSFSRCDASEIVESICNRYEEFTSLHSIKLDRSGIDPGIECTLDSEAFEKIVGNLMSNAMKFANKRISVAMHVDRQSQNLRLEIADDGPGIKEKDIKRIFESFYQVDDHGKHPGSGLGLPLAQSLARMHNGEINVESEYGHGSRFILTIPTNLQSEDDKTDKATETQESDGKATRESEETSDSGDRSLSTVLIVEDNDQLRTFIADNLSDSFNVLSASNGVEAFTVLENKNVDIIISDIMMPDMDGIELCRAIRGNPTFSHLPVILLSAKTDIETKVEGLNIGADAYIEKPFSIEQLRAQATSILESRRRLRENFIKSPLDFYKKPHAEDIQESENSEFVKKLNDLILDNLTNADFNIDGLARMFYMSRSNFHKRVKGITGKTPNDYIRIVRLSKSAELLATGRYQIVEVCYMVGFNTPSYFSKCFSEHFGKLPKDYINNL